VAVALPVTAAGARVFRLPLAAPARCRPAFSPLLEGFEHPLVEIAAVVIDNFSVADALDDVVQLLLQTGAALGGGEIFSFSFARPQRVGEALRLAEQGAHGFGALAANEGVRVLAPRQKDEA